MALSAISKKEGTAMEIEEVWDKVRAMRLTNNELLVLLSHFITQEPDAVARYLDDIKAYRNR
jgi:hypothetical protein